MLRYVMVWGLGGQCYGLTYTHGTVCGWGGTMLWFNLQTCHGTQCIMVWGQCYGLTLHM